MRETMLDLITALATAAVGSDHLADALSEGAVGLRGQPMADVMITHARRFRIDALRARGELAALVEAYMISFGEAP